MGHICKIKFGVCGNGISQVDGYSQAVEILEAKVVSFFVVAEELLK